MKGLLIIIFSFLFSISYAQVIQGRIIDEEENPIEYVSVRVLKIEDSSVVTGAYTDLDGFFSIDKINPEVYLVRITYSSLETIDRKVDLTTKKLFDFGTVQMKMDKAIDIDEVTVTGSLDVLKAGIDKKVYSVEDDLTSKGGTVNDILNNIPSI